MRRSVLPAAAALLLTLAAPVSAVTISGIMVYATTDQGDPNRWQDHLEQFVPGQMWRTLRRGGEDWFGLGVLSGLPPESSRGELLNGPDFTLPQIPLFEGENDFTLLGDAGGARGDDYVRFAVNLYFDGTLDRPGISVLFPRHAARAGDAPGVNKSPTILDFAVQQVNATAPVTYDDGTFTVSVIAASFLAPEEANWDYDEVSPDRPEKDGISDFIGVLKINVEGPPPSTAPVAGPGPGNFGIVTDPGRAVVGAPRLGSDGPGVSGGPSLPQANRPPAGQPVARTESEPTQVSTRDGTTTPAEATRTASPQPQATPSRTAAGAATPTPQKTSVGPTSTPKATGAATTTTSIGLTPTPARAAAAATPRRAEQAR